MDKFKYLDEKTVELAGIAASIAGGCRPCLDYHFKTALESLMKKITQTAFLLFSILTVSVLVSCKGSNGKSGSATDNKTTADTVFKVTFIELGSVRCIPCQQMQPVMKSVKEKYGRQVNVIFYDVWTPEGSPYADKYGVDAIPTQVFLDETGKEYFRHVGFFPEEELVKILNQKGIR